MTALIDEARTVALSPEEHRVASLFVSGLTDDAIARQLGLSRRTVRRRLAVLMTRLGARSRLQAGFLLARCTDLTNEGSV